MAVPLAGPPPCDPVDTNDMRSGSAPRRRCLVFKDHEARGLSVALTIDQAHALAGDLARFGSQAP